MTVDELTRNKDFLGLTSIEKRKLLLDPSVVGDAAKDFGNLPIPEQSKFIEGLTGKDLGRGEGSDFISPVVNVGTGVLRGVGFTKPPTSLKEAGEFLLGQIPAVGQAYSTGKAVYDAPKGQKIQAGAEAALSSVPVVGSLYRYGKSAVNKDFPSMQEAGGELLGQAVMMKGLSKGQPEAGQISRKAASMAKILAQEKEGAGTELVKRARDIRAAKVEKVQKAAAEANAELQAKHQAKVAEIQAKTVAKNEAALAEHRSKVAEIESRTAEKNTIAHKEWLEGVLKARGLKAEQAKVEARRGVIDRAAESYTKMIKDNVDSTHEAVRSSLNQRWEAFRDAVGKNTPLDASKVQASVAEAKSQYLKGSPSSLKVFNDLLGEIGIRDLKSASGEVQGQLGRAGLPSVVQEALAQQILHLDVDTARIHSSAIGERLSSGDLPGNVYQALKHVREGLESEIYQAAKSKGQGPQYLALKHDWGQYERDWNDMRAVATGGSPLARILRAKDPAFVSDQIRGKAANRLTETLAKYKKYGASPAMIGRLRSLRSEQSSLPKIKVPSEPERPEKLVPKLPPVPEMETAQIPAPPEEVRPDLPPEVNPVELRLRKLETAAGRPFHWWEVVPLLGYLIPGHPGLGLAGTALFAEHLALKSPKIRESIAREPRKGD